MEVEVCKERASRLANDTATTTSFDFAIMVSDLFTRTEIRIPSATPSWELDGWRYTPTKTFGSKTSPVVVMFAHLHGVEKPILTDIVGLTDLLQISCWD